MAPASLLHLSGRSCLAEALLTNVAHVQSCRLSLSLCLPHVEEGFDFLRFI